MTNGTRRGWGVSVTPVPTLPPGKTRYTLYRRLGGPQGRSGQVRKISPPPGFDPRTVQPVAQSLHRLSYPVHHQFKGVSKLNGWRLTQSIKFFRHIKKPGSQDKVFNPLNAELNPICHLLALLGVHFLHVSRMRVKSLTLRLLMSYIYIYIYIYGAPILDVSRSHTTTHHSR